MKKFTVLTHLKQKFTKSPVNKEMKLCEPNLNSMNKPALRYYP